MKVGNMSKFNDLFSPMAVNILVSLAAGTLMGWLLKGKFNKQKVLQAAAAGSEAVQVSKC